MYLYILLTGFVDYCTVYSQFPDVSIKVVYIMLRGWSFMFDKKSDVIFFYIHSMKILLDATIRETNFHYKTSSTILISAMKLVLLP